MRALPWSTSSRVSHAARPRWSTVPTPLRSRTYAGVPLTAVAPGTIRRLRAAAARAPGTSRRGGVLRTPTSDLRELGPSPLDDAGRADVRRRRRRSTRPPARRRGSTPTARGGGRTCRTCADRQRARPDRPGRLLAALGRAARRRPSCTSEVTLAAPPVGIRPVHRRWNNCAVTVPNVLAARYASADMVALWSPEHKVVLERRLWIAVLRAQRDLGVDVPDGVDRGLRGGGRPGRPRRRSRARERVTRHDVKARIEEFCDARRARAHPQGHDLAATSPRTSSSCRSARRSSWSATGCVAALARLAALRRRARRRWCMTGRIAQRRRAGHHARQALRQRRPRSCSSRYARLDELIARYPLRGIKGPVGTAAGPARPARRRRRQARPSSSSAVAAHLGFDQRARPASARSTRARSTSTSSPRWCRPPPAPSSAGHDDPADGRPRAGDRGLPAGPGRLVGDAAQDEHPLVRADQRLRR